jgi:integrase
MLPKNDVNYWRGRIFKPRSVRGGFAIESAFFAVKLQHAGRPMNLSLGTANHMEAAERAKEYYWFLRTNGWTAFLSKYRPDQTAKESQKAKPVKKNLTVSEYLAAVSQQTELSPKTIENYSKSFRKIVADVINIKAGKKRFDYRKGGHKQWLEKVHATPLSEITPERIRVWKKRFIGRAGKDELLRRRYSVSCNSFLRQARSLFSKRNVLDKLTGIELPAVLPFEGVNVEPRQDTKFYGCGVQPHQLLGDALNELADRPEELKAFLLAMVVGLRRREADLLEWQSFDFVAGTIRVMPTKWYQLKTNESAAVLPVEPEFLALFRGWRAKAKSEFVIESDQKPRNVAYQHYRCGAVFDALLVWLRAKGVEGQKPFHNLRKLYGSVMAQEHGLAVASGALRHADLRTTAEFYIDRTTKRTPGFGSIISGPKVVKLVPAQQQSSLSGRNRSEKAPRKVAS